MTSCAVLCCPPPMIFSHLFIIFLTYLAIILYHSHHIHLISLSTEILFSNAPSTMVGRPAKQVWAIEVDVAEIGARLEAYLESKQYQQTFIHHGSKDPNSFLSRLPNEILSRIEDIIKHAIYAEVKARWTVHAHCGLGCKYIEVHMGERGHREYQALDRRYNISIAGGASGTFVETIWFLRKQLVDLATERHKQNEGVFKADFARLNHLSAVSLPLPSSYPLSG